MSTELQMELQLREIAVAPRVTLDMVNGFIKSEHYFTAKQGAQGTYQGGVEEGVIEDEAALSLLTFCVLVLQNGYTVYGSSACAYPENFNQQIGNELAKKDATNKIWALLGFELKTKQNEEANSTVYSRLCDEYTQLHDRAQRLAGFIEGEKFQALTAENQKALTLQHGIMCQYREILLERLSLMKPE